MRKLVEVLEHLIAVDAECQKVLDQLKEKQENVEYLVNEELSKRKDQIKTKYQFKMDMRKNEYAMKLAESTETIELEKNAQIEALQTKYDLEKQNRFQQIVEQIRGEK